MTDYVITNGRSSHYPKEHYSGHMIGTRATFCEEADFAGLDSNVLAVPGLPVRVLSSSPVSVGEEFFGMIANRRANDALTGITARTIRLHDMAGGKAQWQRIQPTANTWDWADLDSAVNLHYVAGRDMIFQLFGTPAWASARPSEQNVYGGGSPGIAAEPADMAAWETFCTAVAQGIPERSSITRSGMRSTGITMEQTPGGILIASSQELMRSSLKWCAVRIRL